MENKKGFSLLEVIMALFVLSVGVIGMLTLMSASIANSRDSRDAIVASQLAQEGIELVRNKRDTNIVSGEAGGVFNGIANGACSIDTAGNLDCLAASFRLKHGASGFSHTVGTDTKFSRKVVIENAVDGRRIISLVSWNSADPGDTSSCLNINECVYAETTLTDWAE